MLTEAHWRTWLHFWFAPGSAAALGACRIVAFSTFLFAYLFWFDFAPELWAEVPDAFWMPTRLFHTLGLPVFSGATLRWLGVIWLVSLGAGAVGLLTRTSSITAVVLGLYLCGLPNNFGKIFHGTTVIPLMLLVFACARSGDALSVDAWLRRKEPPPAPNGAYTWPIRAFQLLFAFVFFAAGLSKIRNGGVDWFASDSMRYILLLHHYTDGVEPTRFGLYLAEWPWVYRPMALIVMVCETAAPLALISRRARVTVVPMLALMMGGFYICLGFVALPFLALFAAWIPWDWVLLRLRSTPQISDDL